MASPKWWQKPSFLSVLVVALIGSGSSVTVAVIDSPDSASVVHENCITDRKSALDLYHEAPGAYIPLKKNDPAESQCEVNEVVQKQKAIEAAHATG